tara:strand:+ start:180 stop:362 length:183 start_codon:yes stop_codon:yes gene_type:complete
MGITPLSPFFKITARQIMTEKIVEFPKLSEIDKQWLDLEKQKKIIEKQKEQIRLVLNKIP